MMKSRRAWARRLPRRSDHGPPGIPQVTGTEETAWRAGFGILNAIQTTNYIPHLDHEKCRGCGLVWNLAFDPAFEVQLNAFGDRYAPGKHVHTEHFLSEDREYQAA